MARNSLIAAISGLALGGVIGYILNLSGSEKLVALDEMLESGKISIDTYVDAVAFIIMGKRLTTNDHNYWVARWNNQNDYELNNNLFANSNIPIVGLSSTDSTRARTLGALMVRAYSSLSASKGYGV